METSIIVAIIAATATVTASLIGVVGGIISHRKKDGENVLIGFKGRRYLQEPLEISAQAKNRLKIESDFLLWAQCTILLWVYVPPKGKGLRNSPSNKYLLAHHTGEANRENWTYYNQFVLRHTSVRERWEVQFSNGKKPPQYPDEYLTIGDGLEVGWHQFMIAWDNEKPKLTFTIDGGKGGNDLSTSYRPFWVEELDEKVTVGAWVTDWEGHYCETKLFQLLILDNFLDVTDSIVKEHLKLKPRS